MKNRSKLKEALRPIVKEALSDYLKDSEEETRALQAAHPQLDITSDLPSEPGSGDNATRGVRSEDKELEEASTTAGSPDMGYQTPYAFSDVGLDKDVKKRKIAQQLGMKIVKKESLKEEVRVNIVSAVPLVEHFTPRLIGNEARALYDKISYYMMIASDPQYQTIHKFRRAIDKLKNPVDKKQLIQYFNDEFRISNHQAAWEYYKDPF